MKSQNAKQELIKSIEVCINNNFINKNYREIAPTLKDRIKIDKIADLFNKNIQVPMLKLSEMYWIAKELKTFMMNKKHSIVYEVIKKEGKKEKVKITSNEIDPSNFFTDIEIRNFETEPVQIETKDENSYVFENVYRVTDKQFIIPAIQIKELVDLVYSNFVKYDFRMQRETEKVEYKGIKYERAKTYNKSIKEIRDEMLNHTYIPTAISFNILKTGEEQFLYNDDNHTLTIVKDDMTYISIIDGYHRLMASLEALGIDANLNQTMQLNIFNYDIAEARHFIFQESKKNAINPLLIKHYNQNNIYNSLASEIVNEGNRNNNKLYEMIGTTLEDVKLLDKLTTFDIFTTALEQNFQLDADDMRQKRKIKSYMVEFFNELLSIYKEELRDIKTSRKNNYILHLNSFYLYVYIANEIQFTDNWQDKLEKILNMIDFNKNGRLAELGIENEKITKKSINEIKKYVKDLI